MPKNGKSKYDVLIAKRSFAYTDADGNTVSVNEGEFVHRGHDIVKGHEQMFEEPQPKKRFRVRETTTDAGRR
jgi:hypothetical protein